jgi:hypothetical protein
VDGIAGVQGRAMSRAGWVLSNEFAWRLGKAFLG